MKELILASLTALTFFRAGLGGTLVVELPPTAVTQRKCVETYDEPMTAGIQHSTEAQESYNCEEVEAICKLVYGEARGCSIEGQAEVVWCVLNRVDSDNEYFPDTIMEVVTQHNQFFGYKKSSPVLPEIQDVVVDVLNRWAAEKSGVKDVGRTLPKEYVYFSGDGKQNYFTIEYNSSHVWDWSLYNPYTE